MKKLNTLAKLSIATTMAFGAVAPTAMMMATPIHAQETVGMIDTNNVQNLDVILLNTLTENGSEQTQEIKINDGQKDLVEGKDYKVTGNKATKAGTYTMTIEGINDYHGKKEVEWSMAQAVVTKDIKNTSISLKNTLTYNGKEQRQDVIVKDGSTVLQEGIHYNVSGNYATESGTYTLTVIGMGEYTGSQSVQYVVGGAVMKTVNMKDCKVALTNALTANGQNQTQNVSVSYKGQALAQGVDYTVSGNVAKTAGTYTMTIEGNGIYRGSVQVKYTVAAAQEQKKQDTTKKEEKKQTSRKQADKIAVKEEANTNVGFIAAILAGLAAVVAAIVFFFTRKKA